MMSPVLQYRREVGVDHEGEGGDLEQVLREEREAEGVEEDAGEGEEELHSL